MSQMDFAQSAENGINRLFEAGFTDGRILALGNLALAQMEIAKQARIANLISFIQLGVGSREAQAAARDELPRLMLHHGEDTDG